jgi:hypothetical protein
MIEHWFFESLELPILIIFIKNLKIVVSFRTRFGFIFIWHTTKRFGLHIINDEIN